MQFFSSPKAIFIFICCFAIISTFVRIRWFISAIAVHLMHPGITASAVYNAVVEGYTVCCQSHYLQMLIDSPDGGCISSFILSYLLFSTVEASDHMNNPFLSKQQKPAIIVCQSNFSNLPKLISLRAQCNSPCHPPQNTFDLFFLQKNGEKKVIRIFSNGCEKQKE